MDSSRSDLFERCPIRVCVKDEIPGPSARHSGIATDRLCPDCVIKLNSEDTNIAKPLIASPRPLNASRATVIIHETEIDIRVRNPCLSGVTKRLTPSIRTKTLVENAREIGSLIPKLSVVWCNTDRMISDAKKITHVRIQQAAILQNLNAKLCSLCPLIHCSLNLSRRNPKSSNIFSKSEKCLLPRKRFKSESVAATLRIDGSAVTALWYQFIALLK